MLATEPTQLNEILETVTQNSPLKPPESPQIQPNSPPRLNPSPTSSDTPRIDDDDGFNLLETLRELGISKKDFGYYKDFEKCRSKSDVIKAREKKFREDQQRRKNLIKSAKIPKIFATARATDFRITDNNEESALTAIKAITDNNGLFIYGEPGTGKTMLASIIANERAELFKSSMFLRTVDIFHELNPYLNEDKFETTRKRNSILKTPCLIIDDLGAEKPSDFTRANLFDILDFRMNEQLQTIITTNFNIAQLQNRLNANEELNLSDKIIRRIQHSCEIIELKHF